MSSHSFRETRYLEVGDFVQLWAPYMGHKGVVSGYAISTSIPRLMDDQRDPLVLRHHRIDIGASYPPCVF